MADLSEIVTMRVRTGHDEEFMYDSKVYVVSSKKGLKTSRMLAMKGIEQNALAWNPGTGATVNAKVYIEDDVDMAGSIPADALKPEDVAAFKDTDGLGDDTIIIDGKPVKKHTIDFRNKYEEKDFHKNNVA